MSIGWCDLKNGGGGLGEKERGREGERWCEEEEKNKRGTEMESRSGEHFHCFPPFI